MSARKAAAALPAPAPPNGTEPKKETFSDLVKAAFTEKGVTLRAMGAELGLAFQYIHDVVTVGRIPGEETILSMSEYLGLNPVYMLLLAREERAESPRVAKVYAGLRKGMKAKGKR